MKLGSETRKYSDLCQLIVAIPNIITVLSTLIRICNNQFAKQLEHVLISGYNLKKKLFCLFLL